MISTRIPFRIQESRSNYNNSQPIVLFRKMCSFVSSTKKPIPHRKLIFLMLIFLCSFDGRATANREQFFFEKLLPKISGSTTGHNEAAHMFHISRFQAENRWICKQLEDSKTRKLENFVIILVLNFCAIGDVLGHVKEKVSARSTDYYHPTSSHLAEILTWKKNTEEKGGVILTVLKRSSIVNLNIMTMRFMVFIIDL